MILNIESMFLDVEFRCDVLQMFCRYCNWMDFGCFYNAFSIL